MRCIEFTDEKKYIRDFISLSKKIYESSGNMQNDKELKSLLLGEHPLSKYFVLHKFCIYRGNEIVARFAFTVYPNDDTAYLGFFECVDEDEVAKFLFEQAVAFAKSCGFKQILGPVNASFWMGYRLKTNLFDERAYTGEPYNPKYYERLFLQNGFAVAEHYISSVYKRVEKDFELEKYRNRYDEFVQKGYEIVSPSMRDWDKTMAEIHELITILYQDFPIYKSITKKDFCTYFASYKSIVDLRMVKMAYYRGKAVGFYISIPNYNNSVYHTSNPLNILRILRLRKNPTEYVMLYMGVLPEHQGLGKVLVQSIMNELKESGLGSIGALQRDGKITQSYVNELIEKRYEYVLLKRGL